MEAPLYDLTHQMEDRLWWYRGMRRLTATLLAGQVGRPLEILDAGCGTGGTTRWLGQFGRVTGLDLAPRALALASRRGLTRLVRGSVDRLPFRDGVFDLVTCFDVLYHRAVDDRAALAEFHRVLRPGGLVLVRVPAHDWLRGAHDQAVHTRHRYQAGELAGLLRAAGFRVERLTYANGLLFPVAAAKRLAEAQLARPRAPARGQPAIAPAGPASGAAPAERPGGSGDFWQPPALLDRLLETPLALEAALVRRGLALPIGLSVFALGRR